MTSATPFRINLALGIGVLTVLLVSAAAYITIEKLMNDARDVVRWQLNFTELEQFRLSLKTAESAQRKFLLVPDQVELEDYQQAVAVAQRLLGRLKAADDGSDTRNHLRAFAGSVNRRLEMLDGAVTVRQRGGLTAAIAIVDSDLNRQLRDEIESLSDTLGAQRMRQLAQSQGVNRRNARIVEGLIIGGALLSLLLIAGAIRSINHYHATRRRAEDQLRDSEAMSRAVTHSMADGVVTTGVDGIITEANPAALKLFGYSRDEILGRQVTHLVPERYRGQFDMLLDDLRGRKSGFSEAGREVLAMRKDGSEFPVIVSFGDVVVAGKRLFSAVVHDITKRVRTEEALQASEYQLRQITDSVPALIAYVDRNERYLFHNKAYGGVIVSRVGAIVGKTLHEVLGEAMYKEIRPNVERVLAGQPVSYERTQRSAVLGERDYAVSYVPRYEAEDQQGQVTGFFVMATDITDMKRMDRMKSEFVSTVSHELRTPLTSIRGSLGLIAGGVAGTLPPAVQGLVDIARNNCERLIRLINDILDIEKIESGQMRLALQSVPLQPLLQQAMAANEGFAGQHGVTFRLQAPDSPLLVSVDTDRITQVFTNLLSNAVKFSPKSDVVEITLSGRADRVRVEVRDHGPGIPKEFRQRIFQKFSQADSSDTRQKGGTGLGLSISKAIVERMGGSIGFGNAQGGGTIFFFELPRIHEPAAAAPSVMAEPAASGTRPRILHVEDDPDIQRIAAAITGESATFEFATNVQEARTALRAQHFDMVLLDLILPDGSGWDLFPDISALPHRPPVVVFSVTDVAEADDRGAAALLVKAQTSNEELLSTIQRVLRITPTTDSKDS